MGLRCASCGYDNDPTRVYCHKCGTKLERGAVAPPPPSGFTHPTDVSKSKRLRSPVPWRRYLEFVLQFGLFATLAAVFTLALLPPRHLPAPVQGDESLAKRLSGLVRDSGASSSARSFSVPATDLHRWLVALVKFPEPDSEFRPKPRRVYCEQGDGFVRIGIEASLLDKLDVYFEGDYAPVPDGSGSTMKPLRYSIGRLPLPVALGWPVERQFDGLREALATPLAQLAKASYIGVSPEAATLRWAGTGSR
ncbi:MAG: hypothetical protein RIQ71_2629 [Verrucomicrobiota bacterium]|jgi:hypothetical protein